MPRFSSNDMVHNQYLDEARKKNKKEIGKLNNLCAPTSAEFTTTDNRETKPRSNFKHLGVSLFVSKSSARYNNVQSMVAEKDDISETIVKVDSQMMIQQNDFCSQQFSLKPPSSNDVCDLQSDQAFEPQCQTTFEQNGSSLAPQCQQKFIKQLRQ
ncbi:hypothetical protein Tco_0185339 [Tanacetum coccineum]